MSQAKNGDTVKVHYTGRLDDGTVFDSSIGREPLEFTIGAGQVIPGFDQGVTGMSPGESKTVKIPSDQAYGPRYEENVLVIDRSEFPEDMNPQIGDRLQMTDPEGRAFLVVVTESTPTNVTLDANHPLAGKDLTFDLQLVEIKQ